MHIQKVYMLNTIEEKSPKNCVKKLQNKIY